MSAPPAYESPESQRFAGRLSPADFEALFRAWYLRIVSQAYVVSGGCRSLAEDAAQEAFLKCWRKTLSGQGADVGNWPAWLRITAVHETLNSLKQRPSVRAMDIYVHDRADTGVDLASHMDLRDAFRRVCREVARLSLRQREIVARCAIAGQSLREAAAVMGITEGTARAHLHRARRALDPVWGELKAMGVLGAGEGRQW